jgi:serine/threonine protein kinase
MNVITSNNIALQIDDSAEIHRGGEGRILLLKELPNCVAKLYLPNITPITPNQQKALQVLDNQYFVKPQDLILDKKTKQVLGFVMSYISADFVPLATFFGVQQCRKFKIDLNWKKNVLTKILTAITQAHQNQVVIGDLSGLNILVNEFGEVKFIDVDAYQTPAKPHSGLLLDEIRDYYYQGNISVQSDYFAFSVIAFNLLTYTHPYKGVHKIYKSLAERMINLIPVFKADKDLIIPKCYEPVPVNTWQQQFVNLFELGQRFVFNFTGSVTQIAQNTQNQTVAIPTVMQGELSTQTIYQALTNEWITNVTALNSRLLIKTDQRYLVYDTTNYGKATLQNEFETHLAEDLFVGQHHILAKKGSQLFVYQADKGFIALQNISFTPTSRYLQIDNILAVVEDDLLKFVFLDDINQTFVRVEQTPVFGKGIHIGSGGLYQRVGGRQYIFYHSGKTLSTVLVPFALQDVYVVGNQGVISYKQQQGNEVALLYSYFSIQGLNFQLRNSTDELTTLKAFAYKTTQNQQGLVFEPADNELKIRRTEDYAILQKLSNATLTEQTQLLNTQAGIIAVEQNKVVLLNKRG